LATRRDWRHPGTLFSQKGLSRLDGVRFFKTPDFCVFQ
jgi:hypothetical protein